MLFHGRADGEPVITLNKVPIISQAAKTMINPVTAIVMVFRPSLIFSGEPPAIIITKPPQTINATAKVDAIPISQSITFFASLRKSQKVQAAWPVPPQGTKAAWVVLASD